ncbi:MAG: transglutaminaseTgpA domain-containing protein [Chloroflexota bacterium]
MFTREEPKRSIRLKSPIVPILVVIILGIQLLFPYKSWVILLSGFGGMWLVSYIWARSLMSGLRIDREMRFGWKQVGDRLRERVLLENNSWVPSLWVKVDDHSDMQEYEISSITDVRGWRYQNWHTQGICNHRGLFTIGPVTLETEDPFGIYKVSIDYTDSVNMMVVPPVIALPEIDIASGGRVGEGRSAAKGVKQAVGTVGVREYIPGDSLRWLHWPTIARTGKLYVHLFDNEPSSDWWVLLDLDEQVQVGEGHCSTEEHGVMLAASLVNRGLQLGKHVGLITHGGELVWHSPNMGDAHLWSILRSLATIRPGGPPLEQILQRMKSSLGRNSSLIIITPNLTPGWISALEMLRRLGIIPTVLLLDPVSFGGEGSVDLVCNRLRKLEITHHIIPSDLLDRPQKQTKNEWEWLTSNQSTGDKLIAWDIFWQKAKRVLRTWGLIFLFYNVFANLLDGAVRGLEIGLIWFLIGGGLTVGGTLVFSKLRGWLVGILGGLLGIVFAILRVGSLSNKVFDAFVRIFRLLPDVFSWAYRSADVPDYQPLMLRLNEIWSDGSVIWVRFWEWGSNLLRGQSFYDPVAITFLWSVAIWGAVIWSVWQIIRKSEPLSGVLPPLALVAITVAVVGKTAYDLVFMLGATLVLMVLIHHDARERLWLANQLSFISGIRKNVLIASIALSVGLMVFSLITPSVSIETIADYARSLSGESAGDETGIAQSFGFESQSGEGPVDALVAARAGGLPNEHLIGSGSELSDQVVMVVKIESPKSDYFDTPIYLRNLVYDKYTGRGWESRSTEIATYSAGEELLPNKPGNGFPVRQQVQFVEDLGGFMYATGIPNSADQDFRVAWRVKDYQNGIYDILGATVDGDKYRVDSFVQMHSVDELRAAGQVYPDWIRERYIWLPSTVPEEVLSLAIELTATEATPYDRAVAIERYLRKIPYSLNVSTGPAGTDIVEYFLFRLKKGYCDYYATSMVVLARAAGIPARYVVGYIGEFYDETKDVYIITADQSHAWAEVYFPGYGWVPFEPTGGRPAIERPLEPLPELPDDFELDFGPLVPDNRLSFDNWFSVFGITLFVVIIFILAVWRISDWRLGRTHTDALILIPKLYKRIYRYGGWAGLPVKSGDTAYQFADALIAYLTQLGAESYWAGWILEGAGMIREMTEIFVQCMFNPLREDVEPGDILHLYIQLRSRLWLTCLLGKAYPYRILRPFLWENVPLLIPVSSEERNE